MQMYKVHKKTNNHQVPPSSAKQVFSKCWNSVHAGLLSAYM